MPLQIPPGFPPQFQGPVELALIKAERALNRTISALPPQGTRATWDAWRTRRGNAAFDLVLEVIPSFTDGACEAVRQGEWSLQPGRDEIDKWLKAHLVPHAYTLARLSTYVPMESRVSHFEDFRDTLLARVQESDVWGACLDALLAVADESRRLKAVGFGRTLQAFMDECRWNLADLEKATNIDQKRIIGHLYHQVIPRSRALIVYAQAFSKKLKRPVTAEDLRQSHQK